MSIVHKNISGIALLLACTIMFVLSASHAHADTSLSVTVTPPLIQLSIGPGESWSSSVKIVNNNDYPVTYYTQLVDMQASGEDGRSKFIPLVNEPQDPTFQSFALARWIQMSNFPIDIDAGSSADVPFTVNIPANAEPGGHYAAILVGTQPGSFNQPGNLMRISSYVSSLIFVRIKGDAIESGRIREFTTTNTLYQDPNVDFTLRFENTGNTHVQPAGSITIYNVWGKERGQVLINDQDANFGNVLPQSIRRFNFSWSGEQSLFDIGPYSAVVTLNYGEEGKKSVSATTYFWIVPVVPVSIGLGTLLAFILLITWLIRRYIKRALMLEQMRYGPIPTSTTPAPRPPVIETLIEPLREGVIDLRSVTSRKQEKSTADVSGNRNYVSAATSELSFIQFISKYRLFVVFIVILIAGSILGFRYFRGVLQAQRAYQIHDISTKNETTAK